jgi:hypothetical protein
MLLLPLQKLLNVPLDSIVLVVDNARSPENPVSVRSCPRSHPKQPGSWDDTDSSPSATPPVLIPMRNRRNRIHQKNKNFRFAAISTNGQTGDQLTPSTGAPLRKPIRQLSRKAIHKAILRQDSQDRIHQKNDNMRKGDKLTRSTGTPLRKPIRQLSRKAIHKAILRQDSRNRVHQNNESSRFDGQTGDKLTRSTGAPLCKPIRQLSRKTIHKEKREDYPPPQAKTTKNTMLNLVVKSTTKTVGNVHPPLRVRVLIRQPSGNTIHQGSLKNQSKSERDIATIEALTKALSM